MPILPIPFPALPSGGDLPVRSSEDWLAELPEAVRREPVAPVRDDIATAASAILMRYQLASAYAAAQSDGTRATGIYLDGFLEDAKLPRQQDEDDEAARDRLYSADAIVTPDAIRSVVDTLLAPFTAKRSQIFESVLDRWYVTDGTAAYHAFVTDGTVSLDPDYPDRRYDLRPGRGPGGAWAFDDGDHTGRWMIVRVPAIRVPDDVAFAWGGESFQVAEGLGLFVTDGTHTGGTDNAFVFAGIGEAETLYQTIANVIERIKGGGIRVTLLVDPKI